MATLRNHLTCVVVYDAVFSEPFHHLLRSSQVEGLRLPACSPNLNAFAEWFVRTIRQECLDRMIFFGEASSRRAVEELIEYYNHERSHQSLDNKIIQPEVSEFPIAGTICCRKRLGGLLRYYYRPPAFITQLWVFGRCGIRSPSVKLGAMF